MVFSEAEKKKLFKRNRPIVNRVVRGFLGKNKIGIVHGARSTNEQLPRMLQRKTIDWDIFVKRPQARARQLERKLDKKFGGDFFHVKKGMGSPGVEVWKIKSNVTEEGFVDFANTKRNVPSIPKRGVQLATLNDQKRIAQQNIRNPELKFRREKDLDLIRRINKFQKIK